MCWRFDKYRRLLWIGSLVSMIIYLFFCWSKTESQRTKTKSILFWYEPYRPGMVGRSSNSILYEIGCPVWQCQIINERPEAVEEIDAIVFHQRSWMKTDLPIRRAPYQRYVQLTMESPAWNSPSETEPMANFFNWTMNYRRDSDIVNPYGWFEPHTFKTETKTSVNYAANKTKTAVWFVSNCESSHSGRIELVERLQGFIDVDIYGRCGTLRCPRSSHKDCMRLVESKYKFYLSLENSFCLDYITEKFYDVMRHRIVPIVIDLHGHYELIAPPHSFINAARFSSVRQLADYLQLLDRNDTLYNEYFEWRNNYVVRENTGMCHLCAALHHHRHQEPKVYRNFTDWWLSRSQCRRLIFNTSLPSTADDEFYWHIQNLHS